VASRKRNQIDGQFNARLIEMMESPAYRVLSLSARRVLDRISVELAHHGGNDNGKLPVTYEQFMEYGVHRHAVAPAIREIEALGFVEVTQRGRPSAGEFRLPNLFRLTCVNCKSTPNPTHEWRRIPDMETAEALARLARLAKKQNSTPENRHCATPENRHRNGHSPPPKTITTVPPPKTGTTSISRVPSAKAVSEARPSRCAVASERPVVSAEPDLGSALSNLQAAVTAQKVA
jgi:hypothetical protein